jgi:YHS domain-containing protein
MTRKFPALFLVLVIATATTTGFAQTRRSLRPDKARDPVCGLMVDKDPNLSVNHKGEIYYFCSKADLDQFRKNPERYVRK